MKRFAACLLLVLLLGWALFPRPLDRRESFLHHLKKTDRFYQRLKGKPPGWMQEQIAADFAPFSQRGISLAAIDQTFKAIPRSKKEAAFGVVRYRILQNRLYRFCEEKKRIDPLSGQYTEENTPIEKALKTVIQLASLPDSDFLINYADGTEKPFYLAEQQAPVIGWAKTKSTPYLVLIPDWRSLSSWWFDDIRKLTEGKNYQGKKLSWNEKLDKAFWRGDATEAQLRLQICRLSKEYPERIDSGFVFPYPDRVSKELLPYEQKKASYEEHLLHKYLPVLDGVMCSYPGFQWRLLSDSVAFKQDSDQIQWFYGALQPYVHYIPIQRDMSDLVEKIDWARQEDATCEQIAKAATEFALENLLFADVYYYLYLVLKQYAELQNFKGLDLARDTYLNPKWIRL